MKKYVYTLLALIYSLNSIAQDIKIENKFVLLGMIKDHGMTKTGDCKYYIDSYSHEDSVQYNSFVQYAHQFFTENSVETDLEINTDDYGNKTISSKVLTQALEKLFIIKPVYFKGYSQLLRKQSTSECGKKRHKSFIRSTDFKKLKTWEEKLSFLKGSYIRNGRFYNDTIEFAYLKNYYFHSSQKSNPDIILNILDPYRDELRNIEFVENIHPLQTVQKIRLFSYLIDYDRLIERAVEPLPNTMGPYRPNPIEYLGIPQK